MGTARDESHGNWKGDEASIVAIHHWVARRKKKTGKCSNCGEERYTEWSNVDHRYRRVLDDYTELCKPCHIKYDEGEGITTLRSDRVPWNKGKIGKGRKCGPDCSCGRHRYWSRKPVLARD